MLSCYRKHVGITLFQVEKVIVRNHQTNWLVDVKGLGGLYPQTQKVVPVSSFQNFNRTLRQTPKVLNSFSSSGGIDFT